MDTAHATCHKAVARALDLDISLPESLEKSRPRFCLHTFLVSVAVNDSERNSGCPSDGKRTGPLQWRKCALMNRKRRQHHKQSEEHDLEKKKKKAHSEKKKQRDSKVRVVLTARGKNNCYGHTKRKAPLLV